MSLLLLLLLIPMGALGGFIALIIADQLLHESLWYFVPLSIVMASIIGWGIKFYPGLLRYLVSGTRIENQVREEAIKAFYEKGLHKTRDNTGVLFFISLFEHRVWILADEGINNKISLEILQGYARDIAKGFKHGQAKEALICEIKNVGEILAKYFPIKPDDTNELSNEVIT